MSSKTNAGEQLAPNSFSGFAFGLFSASNQTLDVYGILGSNNITIGRNSAGRIQGSNGALPIPILGGTPTVANTDLIRVFGFGGNDTIRFNESNGALPDARLFGGAGNDTLISGSGADELFGESGNDVLNGKGGNDRLTGGTGSDQMLGEAGDDRMIWNAGDGTDLMEGGDGIDTAEVNGAAAGEAFTLTANGARVRFDQLSPTPSAIDIGTSEKIVVNMGGGDDSFSATGNLAALIGITVDGGAGNDTIFGSNGADLLIGGEGDDFVDGQQGNDTASLGAGDDVFQWDPGDGSDTVDGEDGTDKLLFNGSNGAEIFEASANGDRVRFTRNLGNIVMDLDGIEKLSVNALGSADTIIVNDLSGTDVAEVALDLAGTLGGATGDSQADTVITNATNGGDVIEVGGSNGGYSVTGLPVLVTAKNSEAIDNLVVNGLDGDDSLSGALLEFGTAKLTLDGGGGNDTLLGSGDSDVLLGGDGNDTLTGGNGDDQISGGAGDDRMIWNPGDDSDLFEGGADIDTAEVNGGGGDEVFTATANGTRVRFDRLDPAPFSLDIGTTENLVVAMGGGNDSFSATGNLAALIKITVDGGAGNDTILGSNGQDTLIGGEGDDFIDGQQGNDTAFLGAGNDVFQWDPGDGSDTVEGQEGSDELLFNGSAGAEIFEASANGDRVRFTRNLGNIVMDLDGVEKLSVNALGNSDTIVLNDLTGTDVTEVAVDLAGTIGGTSGDGQADVVITNATDTANVIDVFGSGSSYSVVGLSAQVNVSNSEGANDSLVINGLDGDDSITATTLPAGVVKLTLDGGEGNDTLFGSQGADVLIGGDGNDFVFGDNGNDVALLGAGDDVFQWEPGDGNDTIEGQDGVDELRFFGSNASENVNILANGGRALFLRDVANITMDMDDMERIDFRALGGVDNIVIGDLSGTDLTHIAIDLGGANGGGDGAADTVTANGTQGDDVFGIAGDAGGIQIFGLAAQIEIFEQEQGNDLVVLNALGGNDVIDATSLEADGIQLTMNGGLGDDIFLGSEGDDLINGGDGDDVALMGAGDDTFVWNPGDDNDTLEGQAGFDTMRFNGSNAAENISISANGGRVTFFRDIANVTMDVNDMEAIDFNALGGADTITIGDLSGTDVTEINLNLAGAGGGGDGQADTIVINGTAGDDVVLVVGDDGGISILGLAAQVNITGFEAGLDRIVINGLAGDDVIEASGLDVLGSLLTADGGGDDDILIGGVGDDVLLGGEGDDVLLGGGGTDFLDGGPGDDVELLSAVANADPMIPVELMVA